MFVLLTIFAFTAGVVSAQNPGMGKKIGIDERVEKMKKELNLNDKQSQQLKALFTKQAEARKAEREMNKAKQISNREATDKELQSILTQEQYAKYKESCKAMRHGDKKNGHKHNCNKQNCKKHDCNKQNCNKQKDSCNKKECNKHNYTKQNQKK